METIMEILLGTGTDEDCGTPRKRFLACRRAILHAENLDYPLRAPQLAAAVGVSQRVLEMGFKEMLGISPQKFLRWSRLNNLRRDLRRTRSKKGTVTEMARRWGFQELGRTAVEYKRLFGESPSRTLSLKGHPNGTRLVDALRTISTGRDTGLCIPRDGQQTGLIATSNQDVSLLRPASRRQDVYHQRPACRVQQAATASSA